MVTMEEIANAIAQGKIRQTRELVNQAIDEGAWAGDILNLAVMDGVKSISRRFAKSNGMVSDVLVSARAVNESLEILKPILVPKGSRPIGRACIGTVRGDLHDMGKNIVRLMLENRNIEIVDLGVDVPPEAFVRAVVEDQCELVCCSALLTATVPEMKRVVDALKAAGVRDRVLVMVGGMPVTAAFARRIGADIFTEDGFAAADRAEEALRARREAQQHQSY